jgi:hypothetical protein
MAYTAYKPVPTYYSLPVPPAHAENDATNVVKIDLESPLHVELDDPLSSHI